MSEVFHDRDFEVDQAKIEFNDVRYAKRFAVFPLRHVYRDLFRMIPPQLRRASGQIRVPDAARHGDYDLVCIGSPTWWLTTSMPVRSYLKSHAAASVLRNRPFAVFVVCRRYWRNNLKTIEKLGSAQGGHCVGRMYWVFAGGQIRSLLSMLSYLGTGEDRPRYLGVRIPRTNLTAVDLDRARVFAGGLADRLQPTAGR